MRKPRDFDADLKALEARANQLKTRKQQQLGELVIATGADALPIEELAGALLAAAASTVTAPNATERQTREGWRKAGAAFFQRGTKSATSGADRGDGSAPPLTPSAQPAQGSGGAA
ncbi:conjugal transfer protein TraD [Novosphingobium terrae]|uniref:conjugal transfer protein TraD n=1 Tax=Novosphingobium terrae TaxID=2726189 RepID=UPI0019821292|nr:conjugal transfer protein TraD [Novosphingobium terrae]